MSKLNFVTGILYLVLMLLSPFFVLDIEIVNTQDYFSFFVDIDFEFPSWL